MPEYPDIRVYIDALERKAGGQTLERLRLGSAFVLRSVEPPISAVEGRRLCELRRIGKRIAMRFGSDLSGSDLFIVVHLMISGRLRWKAKGAKLPKGSGLAAFDFEAGSIVFTEVSKKKRAWIRVVEGEDALRALDPAGLEVMDADLGAFTAAITRENRTLKRALTDPRILSGIGNAYSDEILFEARLSPVRLTGKLAPDEIERLYHAIRGCLGAWYARLSGEVGDGFPDKVTAFRDEMYVHGRYGQPCRVCGAKVQRIVYASNETNYCATCQTGGKLLADRSLSRLLKRDWPRSLEELELQIEARRL